MQDQVVWVIGASSGIGEALAVELARRGAKVVASARREERLRELAQSHGWSMVQALDVTEPSSIRVAFENILEEMGSVDRIVFMSASYTPMTLDDLAMDELRQIIDVNLVGAFNLINVCLPAFKAVNRGQMAFCASVAGYRGLPNSQPYASTKAGVINLVESLRAEVDGTGVDIKLISPGFVRTQLTDKNEFKMPAIIEPAQAALYIADGLEKRAFEIHFPKRFTRVLKFVACLPYGVWFWLMRRAPKT